MKKLTAISTLFALATSAFAADLTLDATKLDGSTWSWSDAEMWLPADSTVNGSSLDISFNTTQAQTSTADVADLGDVKIQAGTGNTSTKYTVNFTTPSTLSSLTIDNTGKVGNVYVDTVTKKSKLSILNELNIISDGVNAQSVHLKTGTTGFNTGCLNITNNKDIDTFKYEGASNISGAVTMRAAEGATGAKFQLYTYGHTWGGLDDGGVVADHYLSTSWEGSITFTNAIDCSWTGQLKLDGEQRTDIAMKGSATQRICATSSNLNFRNITVTSGRLELSMPSNLAAKKLTINGGVFKAEGDFSVNTLILGSGTIAFADNSGKIIVPATEDATIAKSTISATADNKINIDFEELTQTGIYTIAEINNKDSSWSDDANDNFVAINLKEDWLANFKWEGNALQAIITSSVPEPATVATIFGAVALALTMYRRRK